METFNCWGIKNIKETGSPEYKIWQFEIRNPFRTKDGWEIGLNEKFLLKAIYEGVKIFQIKLGEKMIEMNPPNEKYLKEKTRKKEYQDEKSMFKNGAEMRVFLFKI